MSNVKVKNRRKVVDIQSLSAKELYALEREKDRELDALRAKHRDLDENTSIITAGGVIATIGTIMKALSSGPVECPPALAAIFILEGAWMVLPTIRKHIKGKKLENQIYEKRDEFSDIFYERHRKEDEDVFKKKKKEVEKDLIDFYNELVEANPDKYQKDLIQLEMKTLIEEGVDKKLLMMPGIQKLFDAAIIPWYRGEHRVFIHNVDYKDIKSDGTFSFGTHKKPIYCLIEDDHSSTFTIRYCEKPDEDHYLEVKHGKLRIYLNKDGQITSIGGKVDTEYHHEEISVPFTGEKIAKEVSIEQLKKMNAAMAALTMIESELGREHGVPTIDFEKIGRADGTIGEGYSQSTDVPVIEVPEQRQEGGFRR